MTERYKISLSGIWLLVSFTSIVLPVFLPTYSGSTDQSSNVIGTATFAMFILSFPSSLFALPFMVFLNALLGIYPFSIGTMYLNLLLFFVLGLVQWFWIVPRLWFNKPTLQTLDLPLPSNAPALSNIGSRYEFDFQHPGDETPLERVIQQEDR